jgi:hypothetical protein
MHQYLKQTYLCSRRRLLLAILSPLFYQKAFEIHKIISCKNKIYLQEIIKSRIVCYIFRSRHAVVIIGSLRSTTRICDAGVLT